MEEENKMNSSLHSQYDTYKSHKVQHFPCRYPCLRPPGRPPPPRILQLPLLLPSPRLPGCMHCCMMCPFSPSRVDCCIVLLFLFPPSPVLCLPLAWEEGKRGSPPHVQNTQCLASAPYNPRISFQHNGQWLAVSCPSRGRGWIRSRS